MTHTTLPWVPIPLQLVGPPRALWLGCRETRRPKSHRVGRVRGWICRRGWYPPWLTYCATSQPWNVCCDSTTSPSCLEPSPLPARPTTRCGGRRQLTACWPYSGERDFFLFETSIFSVVTCAPLSYFSYTTLTHPHVPTPSHPYTHTPHTLTFTSHPHFSSYTTPPHPHTPPPTRTHTHSTSAHYSYTHPHSHWRHSLSNEVLNYVHTKGCVGFCIRNIRLSIDQSPLDLVEIFATIFCCLKDSTDISQVCIVY